MDNILLGIFIGAATIEIANYLAAKTLKIRRFEMPKGDKTGPPTGSGGSRTGKGGGKGRAPGKGTGKQTGGKRNT